MSPHAANFTYQVLDTAFWGPVTATLDWCEANYQFSRYIAETANTFSNVITLAYAFYGIYLVQSARLPPRYLIGWTGFALVGLGSFIFHATLLYEAQLADELPMVYVASYCCAVLFDSKPGYDLSNPRTSGLFAFMIAFNALFTWAYAVYRNPVFHQVVFATIMLTNVFRTTYILKNSPYAQVIPAHDKQVITHLFSTGAATFILGFLIWNLDNIFCFNLTSWKHEFGWPGAFLLEGHSWWHILTATGTYLMLVGNTYLTLGLKDNFSKYKITSHYGLPALERADAAAAKAKVQ
ncbi:ceramidase [Phanerochaete sordida]|uniref:Ceramidase n=1 Tax=Phanerochaete sordida TaxID=48140 RepID=A0A9P3G906_9APHY|nr:ceramidase [Phanerochaete sordida]